MPRRTSSRAPRSRGKHEPRPDVAGQTDRGSTAVWPAPPVPWHHDRAQPTRPAGCSAPTRTTVLVSWAAVVSRTLVAVVLVALVGLLFWSLAPRVAGFQGHVVVSGSMAPRLAPGDVVLTRELPVQQLQPGQVLLFPDPERPDRLLLHRLVSFDAEGDLVTRGDANQSNDSTHVPADSVIGQAQLRIPYIGLPAYWRVQGQWAHIGLVAGLLAAATVFATGGGPRHSTQRAAAVTADAVPASPPDAVPSRTAAAHHAPHRVRYQRGHRVGPRAGHQAVTRDRQLLSAGTSD